LTVDNLRFSAFKAKATFYPGIVVFQTTSGKIEESGSTENKEKVARGRDMLARHIDQLSHFKLLPRNQISSDLLNSLTNSIKQLEEFDQLKPKKKKGKNSARRRVIKIRILAQSL